MEQALCCDHYSCAFYSRVPESREVSIPYQRLQRNGVKPGVGGPSKHRDFKGSSVEKVKKEVTWSCRAQQDTEERMRVQLPDFLFWWLDLDDKGEECRRGWKVVPIKQQGDKL